MCTYLLFPVSCVLFLVFFSFPFTKSSVLRTGNSLGWEDNAISLDVIEDLNTGGRIWSSTRQWFEYSNTSSELEEVIQKNYPVNSEDLDWDQFSDSIGIWGLFHEDIPPIHGIGPPSFAYGAQTPVLNVIIKYRLHGSNASIVVYNSFEERARIVYDCDQYFCEDGFHEAVIPLSDKPGTVGQFKFNVTLITKNKGEFILIDSISATGAGATLPPSTTQAACNCECEAKDQNFEDSEDSLDDGVTWEVKSFKYFNTSEELYDSEILLEWGLDFENSTSIWLAITGTDRRKYKSAKRPFVNFKDTSQSYNSLELRYYLGGSNSSLLIFVTEHSASTPLATLHSEWENSAGESGENPESNWKTFQLPLGLQSYNIRIEADLPNAGDFALIDSLIIKPWFPSTCYPGGTTEMYSSTLDNSSPSTSKTSSGGWKSSSSMRSSVSTSMYSSSTTTDGEPSSQTTTSDYCDCSTFTSTTTTPRPTVTPTTKKTTTKTTTRKTTDCHSSSTDDKSTSEISSTSKMSTTTTPGKASLSTLFCTHLLLANFFVIFFIY